MNVQVTITRTDTGANTHVRSDTAEASKDIASWSDAITEAERLGLINAAEVIAAKALPPGFPLHASANTNLDTLIKNGFVPGTHNPPH